MKDIDRYFIGVAVVFGLAGMAFGIWMSLQLVGEDARHYFAPAHAHNNLVGWVGLAIAGLVYRAFPSMQNGVLPVIHFALAVLGAVFMVMGLLIVNAAQQTGEPPDETIVKIGSVITVLAFLLFVWIFFTRSGKDK